MKKIVCVIYEYPEDKFWLNISLKSYLDWADKIIMVNGTLEGYNSGKIDDFMWDKPMSWEQIDKIHHIDSPYPHEDLGADGKQRNQYLRYIQEHFDGELAIVVDSDEVLADDAKAQIEKIEKQMIENNADVFNARMEHFIDNFGWVDSSQDYHYCPGRIFKISKDLEYPEVEHVFLKSKTDRLIRVAQPILQPVFFYHYGYTKGRETILKKYNNHLLKSNIHTKNFLESWKNTHLFGTYPRKMFLGEHPKPVKEAFHL